MILADLALLSQNVTCYLNGLIAFQELLTSTSEQLFETSDRRARFDSISVLLPASWSGSDCLNGRPINDKISATYQPDFVIGGDHPIFGAERPIALQYGQCGESGLGIRVPHKLLSQGNLTDFTSKF